MVTSPAACITFWIGESTHRSFAEWGAESASATTSSSSTWRVPQQTRVNREGRGPTGLRPFVFPVNPPSRRGCRRRPRSGVVPLDLYLRTGILGQDHHLPGTHLHSARDSHRELLRTPSTRSSQNSLSTRFGDVGASSAHQSGLIEEA